MWIGYCTVFAIFIIEQCLCLEYNASDCDQPSCLKCGPKGCTRCLDLILYPTRECVSECPFGHVQKWSTMVDFIGRVCQHNGNFLGLSTNALAVLTGVITGTVLCIVFISAVVVYIKYKRKSTPALSETSSEIDDSPEKKDFLKQLETLRPYAPNYLDMLNDTRRQIRVLHSTGDSNAISAYRPVIRDLAKILMLLNRPVEKTAMPDEWDHLFNWAEKALKRYKRMSETSQPQVAQLINFLQGPVLPTDLDKESDYSVRGSTAMSTFKPDHMFGSSLSLQDIAINNFNSNYDSKCHLPLNPQWKFEYSLVSNHTPSSEFNPSLWKNSKEYLNNSLFLEDDFYQLGFRPQDEITTEL
ncbi:FU domain-containing protein T48 [Leptinotarsa decemlineata]|uniref:FU domain-containing protein T48 n=1 Tax=Leptinotarsa decemlineata TaxID=7539 RepID=UPI003D3095FD